MYGSNRLVFCFVRCACLVVNTELHCCSYYPEIWWRKQTKTFLRSFTTCYKNKTKQKCYQFFVLVVFGVAWLVFFCKLLIWFTPLMLLLMLCVFFFSRAQQLAHIYWRRVYAFVVLLGKFTCEPLQFASFPPSHHFSTLVIETKSNCTHIEKFISIFVICFAELQRALVTILHFNLQLLAE